MKTESNPTVVLSALTSNLATLPAPISLGDPNLKELLNSASILHQFTLVDRILERAQNEQQSKGIDALFCRTLGLIERTRARLSREEALLNASVPTTEREEARHFLNSELASGPRSAKELLHAARTLGISQKTLYRAKSDLSVHSQQVTAIDDPKLRSWLWSLPASSTIDAPQT